MIKKKLKGDEKKNVSSAKKKLKRKEICVKGVGKEGH
jgi:hypothetical protein